MSKNTAFRSCSREQQEDILLQRKKLVYQYLDSKTYETHHRAQQFRRQIVKLVQDYIDEAEYKVDGYAKNEYRPYLLQFFADPKKLIAEKYLQQINDCYGNLVEAVHGDFISEKSILKSTLLLRTKIGKLLMGYYDIDTIIFKVALQKESENKSTKKDRKLKPEMLTENLEEIEHVLENQQMMEKLKQSEKMPVPPSRRVVAASCAAVAASCLGAGMFGIFFSAVTVAAISPQVSRN